MIKTPLRYPGGKTKIANNLLQIVYPEKISEYREPFLGGGSVFLSFLHKYKKNTKFWINDIYKPLICFWDLAINKNDVLIKGIEHFFENSKNGKDLFLLMKELINSSKNIEKAIAFFVLNRITFSGTIEAGGYSKASFNKRFTESSIKRVQMLSKITSNIKISSLDYEKLITKPGENVFIFLDPPYYSAKKSMLYGKNGKNHINFNFERLSSLLKKTKHKWMMTIDDSKYIKKIFSFAYFQKFSLTYGMRRKSGKSKLGKELLVSNFKIKF